ncbi:hypothetical protein SOASR016_11960 [Pectobacterium carotovorum subsp. carotovorum]|uniref:Uncharacterized protein n=1 Tax=Pectobacterium carotovorum subsp. carotovorum TaxID=555 RepID=A0ABQ5L4D7_PECCC|nr:hypothetical protein SOASR014_01590 [Pectobacterium carotovorum subsp. carotovorum]GKX46444.1 hypothetical protein SOASR016_11960 [Pectobacterium carotovorum subsp. carotovorum]GLX42740.1 hypothetical protein Pcaca01_04080 [Pectobacterium carotovorum subsp. carotovorum]
MLIELTYLILQFGHLALFSTPCEQKKRWQEGQYAISGSHICGSPFDVLFIDPLIPVAEFSCD